MPLIIVTGFPQVGKSTWAQHIESHLKKRGLPSVVHSEESMGIDKSIYGTLQGDKHIAQQTLSVAKRDLSKTQHVILDLQNYNSGLRYQLWCEAKQMSTSCITVHVQPTGPMDTSDPWMKLMVMRYEEPKEQKRWEQPLFTVDKECLQGYDMSDMDAALASSSKPNKAVSNSTIPSNITVGEIFTQLSQAIANGDSSVKLGQMTVQIPANTSASRVVRLKRQLAGRSADQLPALIQKYLQEE